MEGFKGGSSVHEGYSGNDKDSAAATIAAAAAAAAIDKIYKEYTAKRDEYTAALNAFNDGGTYAQSKYFDTFVKVEKTAAVPGTGTSDAKSATYDVYYVNKYGYLYNIPKGVTTTNPAPVITDGITLGPTEISKVVLAGFRKPTLSADKYVAAAGQVLNLAGTIVKFTVGDDGRVWYLWVDIEGVAHQFNSAILSDINNNCHKSCFKKIPTVGASDLTAVQTAIGEKLFNTTPISSSSFVCSELPTNVVKLKAELDVLVKKYNDALIKSDSGDGGGGGGGGNYWWDPVPQPLSSSDTSSSGTSSSGTGASSNEISSDSSSDEINLQEYDALQKNMVTYDGKVGDSTLNVKSKLGYYILWVSLMLFIVVVTFRNIANSESTESGSFMISAALLILLLIYLFNYLSDLRIGPQQMMSKAVGALPEKVSGMIKFTFT
jgi:hypothetical protein